MISRDDEMALISRDETRSREMKRDESAISRLEAIAICIAILNARDSTR